MADIPTEILWCIYRYLKHSDLRAAGATCKHWRKALCVREFHENTVVRFSGIQLSDSTSPTVDFLRSERPFRNLILESVRFGSVSKIMAHMGESIEHITFDNIDLDYENFQIITDRWPKLQTLVIKYCPKLFRSDHILVMNTNRNSGRMALSTVKHLTLKFNDGLCGEILQRLTEPMDDLGSLDLSGCKINRLDLELFKSVMLQHKSTLRELNLSYSLMSGPTLHRVQLLTEVEDVGLNLTHLRLSGFHQVDVRSINAFLATQPGLVLIDLSGVGWVKDEVLQNISTCNAMLQEINILGSKQITNVGARCLGFLKNLRRLNISHCDGIGCEGLTEGIAKGPYPIMRELRMSYLPVSNECIRRVSASMTELRVLDVSNCMNGVTNETVQCVIKNCRWLRELYLDGCQRISDSALTGMGTSKSLKGRSIDELRGLTKLSVKGCNNISDVSLKYIFKLKELRCLDLSKCQRVRIKDFDFMEATSLEEITMSDCRNITDRSIKFLTSNLPRLRSLNLSNCSRLTNLTLEAILSDCKCLHTLNLEGCSKIHGDIIKRSGFELPTLHNVFCDYRLEKY